MDSLLILGNQDSELKRFLTKMGYSLFDWDQKSPIEDSVTGKTIDLILLDARLERNGIQLCRHFRNQDSTKQVPIVYLAPSMEEAEALRELSIKGLEIVEQPASRGAIVSRIVTQLRRHRFSKENASETKSRRGSLHDLSMHFAKELDEARTLQEILIPKTLPNDKRFDICGAFRPLQGIGGDLYFIHEEESGKVTVLIADVTGHGFNAAYIGGMTKLTMCAAKTELPHELLSLMNRLMSPQIPEGKFVTMFGYLFDPETGELDCARAGHPPALVLNRKSGRVLQIKGEGFPIGFFPDSKYTHEKAKLEVNDLIVTFTDGISEALSPLGDSYGYERIADTLLRSHATLSAQEVLRKIKQDLDEFTFGQALKDDATIVVLKRNK